MVRPDDSLWGYFGLTNNVGEDFDGLGTVGGPQMTLDERLFLTEKYLEKKNTFQ
jgi:hypothetical protein